MSFVLTICQFVAATYRKIPTSTQVFAHLGKQCSQRKKQLRLDSPRNLHRNIMLVYKPSIVILPYMVVVDEFDLKSRLSCCSFKGGV